MMRLASIVMVALGAASAQQILTATNDKCDVWAQDDERNRDRVIECSSLQQCKDTMRNEYSDTMCGNSNERCGAWNITETYYDGCILSKYCDEDDVDYEGTKVHFRCPNGEKDDHDDRWALVFNL